MGATDPRPSRETHTFLFADLAGYTALTEAHGDEHAADAAAEFCEAIRGLLPEHEAEEVKAIGDALMVWAPDAHHAANLAERIVCDYGVRHRGLGVRVGMHTGTAVRRGGDWFGSGVNLASRVADVARAGEVLLTETTRRALGEHVPVRSRGRRTFKNVSTPLALFELVLARDGPLPALPLDPVCRMAIDPARASERQIYRGVEYHFCSDRCASAFRQDTGRYTRQRSARGHVLVSDQAREHAAARLQRAYQKGRIEAAELEERVQRSYGARTRAELQAVTHDLPRRFRRRPLIVLLPRWIVQAIAHQRRRLRRR